MKKGLAALIALLIALPALSAAKPALLEPKAAYALIARRKTDKRFVILDVRSPEEYASGHLRGATNMDFNADGFERRLAGLDREATYLVHCAKGGRSGKAVAAMKKLGFEKVNDLKGGFDAWTAEGLPTAK